MTPPTPAQEGKMPERLETDAALRALLVGVENGSASHRKSCARTLDEVLRRYNSHAALTAQVERLAATSSYNESRSEDLMKLWEQEVSILTARVKELEEAGRWALRGLEMLSEKEAKRLGGDATKEGCDYTFAKELRRALGDGK